MLASARSRRPMGITILHIAIAIALAFGSLAAAAGYWGVVVAPDLVRSPYDAAVIAASRTVERGRILDRRGAVLARNERDKNGELYRAYANQAVSQVVGYSSRRFGSAGLERAYSAELAGLAVDPAGRCTAEVRRRPVRPAGPPPVAVLRPAARGDPRVGRPEGRGRHARPDDRRDPRARLDAHVRRLGDRRPEHRRRRRSRRSRTIPTIRCCRARRSAATCRAPCSRS